MVYDSIPTAASNAKEFVKKKRVNRTAKLKQCKLDVRREQWLSQVKNKGLKEDPNGAGRVKIPAPEMHAITEGEPELKQLIVKLDINPGCEKNEGLMNHYSDSDWSFNSPTSHTSSVLGSNRSVTNFTGSSRSSSSSSSGGCCSGEEDDGDNGCLDDWEAIADALAADDINNNHNDHNLESPLHEHAPQQDSLISPVPEPIMTTRAGQEDSRAEGNCRAWRPDDAFRPQTLPNLLKQNSFPMNSERHYGSWGLKNVGSAPSSCPICCEDLDMTDSSFVPCPCGYRLCLFCYKRILEDNGRCPGCRKQYDQPEPQNAPSKLGRSYSMITSIREKSMVP